LDGVEGLRAYTLLHEETKQWWGEWLRQAGVSEAYREKGPMFQNAHLSLQAAEAGQGFALADTVLAADALADGRLIKPFDMTSPGGGYYLVRPPGVRESPATKSFREWLQAEMAAFGAGASI
jgi:LysR family glycine cleavage system transcriptional activator